MPSKRPNGRPGGRAPDTVVRVTRIVPALAALAFSLLLPAAARAADPVMALEDVRSGMQCTGYSVVRGTDISPFDVEVLDVVDGDPALGSPRILVRASGPAVDATGIGPGFSGSPILCRDGAGVARSIGAISESIGEYGGAVVLATPIEAILGTPVDAPRARRAPRLLARARPLRSPLAISGLSSPLGRLLAKAGTRGGTPVVAVPAGPLGAFPAQILRPGSAMAAGYASGDISAGAIGTVSYTDGDRVWGFGHPLEGAGARALLLQDAYVFRVISNPNVSPLTGTSYKLAAPGHVVGSLTSDGVSAVAGRLGRLPSTVPVRVGTTDEDTGERRAVSLEVADETDLDFPTGPNLPFFGPLAMVESIARVLRSAPPRLSGSMCARIRLRERREPLRFCSRYVVIGAEEETTGFAGALAEDLNTALAAVDDYKPVALHMTEVRAEARVVRGERAATLRRVRLPARLTPGRRVSVRLELERRRAGRVSVTVPWTVPRGLKAGQRRFTFRGEGTVSEEDPADAFVEELTGGPPEEGSERPGPRSLDALARLVDDLERYDGVVLRAAGRERRFFRHPELLITGSARATARVVRARRR